MLALHSETISDTYFKFETDMQLWLSRAGMPGTFPWRHMEEAGDTWQHSLPASAEYLAYFRSKVVDVSIIRHRKKKDEEAEARAVDVIAGKLA